MLEGGEGFLENAIEEGKVLYSKTSKHHETKQTYQITL